eukprot:CCRYP_021137-RA/>CCRYP_021137-RA protein AED:0.01 eAED:0.01 QI:259/1/1/1/1/1/2/302/927
MPSSPRNLTNIHPLTTLDNDDWEPSVVSTPSPANATSTQHPSCSAQSRSNNKQVAPSPSRLFLRTPIPHSSPTGLHFALGPFEVSIVLTPIDSSIVLAAKQKIEKRRMRQIKSEKATPMGSYNVNVHDPAREAVNGVFEYEYNETEVEAPKLANLRIVQRSVSHGSRGRVSQQEKVLWSSAPGVNFVGGAHVDLSVMECRDADLLNSSTSIHEHVLKTYNLQTIDSIERGPAHAITIRGQLGSEIVGGALEDTAVDYTLVLSLADHEGESDGRTTVVGCSSSVGAVNGHKDGTEGAKVLAFQLQLTEGEKTTLVPNQAHLFGVTDQTEAFFGFGHRLSNANARGMQIHVLNQSTKFSRSTKHKNSSDSCCTVPQFITSHSRGLYLHNTEPSVFDLRANDWFSIRVQCSSVSGVFIGGNDMLDTLRIYTSLRGRTKMLPSWTQRNGVILGISGGTDAVRTIVQRMKENDCPVAGVLIHDWSGIVDPSSNETRIWYNWIIEREHYKYWQKMVAELDAEGICLGVYVNPMIEEIPVHLRSGRRYLFGEALREGYLIKSQQGDGKRERVTSGSGSKGEIYQMNKKKCPRVGLLDTSNYLACQWWKNVVRSEVMDYAGASFWIADMGESAPIVNSLYHKQSINGLSFHNAYPQEWARVNREAIKDAGREGDSFFLTKAGYGLTPKYAGSTCLGDQVVNYKSKDGGGLQSVLNGILNGGFSGFTYGHCAVSFAVPRTVNSLDERAREMICRWMEMNAFTALFRTHDCTDGTSSVCAYNNGYILHALARWSVVYASLADYRMKVSSEASFRGYPVARHPILHFPMDREFRKSSVSAFMLGDRLFIAPVMKYGVSKVKVYLPEGKWIHLWSGNVVTKADNVGTIVEVQAPLGKPPVFYRECDEMSDFVSDLKRKAIICPEKEVKKNRWWPHFSKA